MSARVRACSNGYCDARIRKQQEGIDVIQLLANNDRVESEG
jgi:hypothetical protein